MKKIFMGAVGPLAAIPLCAFTQAATPSGVPHLFAPGTVSTQDFEYGLTLSPDGRTVLFARGDAGYNRLTILESRLDNGRWSRPRVASFSGIWKDTDPQFSPDGRRIMFISTRPVSGTGEPRKDYDIWFVERQGKTWSEPRHLEGPLNTDGNEASPTLTRDGTLYFEAARPDHPGTHIYRSRLVNGQYGEPELLGFAGKGSDINPAVSADGSFIIFASKDRGGAGGMDLFITFAGPTGRGRTRAV